MMETMKKKLLFKMILHCQRRHGTSCIGNLIFLYSLSWFYCLLNWLVDLPSELSSSSTKKQWWSRKATRKYSIQIKIWKLRDWRTGISLLQNLIFNKNLFSFEQVPTHRCEMVVATSQATSWRSCWWWNGFRENNSSHRFSSRIDHATQKVYLWRFIN